MDSYCNEKVSLFQSHSFHCPDFLLTFIHSTSTRYISDVPPWKREVGLPSVSHDILEEPNQIASVRYRGACLSGFELLMRHVELWREGVRGNVM
jgi:hypothetical protein